MSQLEVDKIIPQSGTTLTIGDSGDTITISSGAGFQSNGIYDNSSSTSLFINGSNRVTVGTDSGYGLDNSADDFVVANILSNSGMSIVSNASNSSSIFFTDTGVSSIGKIVYSHSSDDMKFTTANSEAMRIDSSGNLLVGKTATGISNAGISVLGGANAGTLEVRRDIATANSSSVGYISRGTSDGNILTFYKDTSSVGSIGHTGSGGACYIAGSNNVGLQFNNVSDEIRPCNSDGSARDNAIDLGNATRRFKDLYLGGGAYLGGTGTANKLDDYEEGSWTPTASSGVTAVSGSAKYRKVGSLVYVQAYLDGIAGKSANNLIIGGLPFSTTSDGYAIGNIEGGSTSGKMGTARPSSSSTSINFYYPNTSTLQRTNYLGDDVGNFIIFSLTYHTA